MEKIGLEAVLEDANFQAGLKRYSAGIGQMTKITDNAAAAISGAFKIAMGGALVGIGAFTAAAKVGLDTTLEWSEGLDALGDQFGMTGEQGSAFQFLANKVGVSVDEMGMGLKSIINGLQGVEDRLKSGKKELSPFETALSKLGLSAFNAKGKLKTFDELLPELMDAFNKLPPGIKASSIAMDLFGTRGGSKFLDFLRQGSKGLDEARAKAKELGLELSTDEVNAAEEFGFAMNELNLGIKGFWNQIGKFVLPIAKQFVSFVNEKVIPALAKWTKDNLPKLIAQLQRLGDWIGKNIVPILSNLFKLFTDNSNPMQNFANLLWSIARAFTASDEAAKPLYSSLVGIWDAVLRIGNAFKNGGLAGGLQEISKQLQNAFKNVDWAKVLTGLDTLKTQFWNWLTGKGGVIEQVGAQVGKVVTEIQKWLSDSKNTKPIVDAVLGWVNQFWSWVTDPNGGVIATIATEMAKLVANIKAWSEAETTKQQFRDIGKTIANTVLDGIGQVFSNPGEGRNLLVDLYNTFNQAYTDLRQFFANIGSNLASGIVEGIASRFVDGATAQRIAGAVGDALNQLYMILTSPGGPILGIVQKSFQFFVDNLNALLQNITQYIKIPNIPLPNLGDSNNSNNTGGSSGFANGGFVGKTGNAMVHAGEYVLNRRQVAALAPILNNNNSRTINASFTHNWTGASGGMNRSEIESIAEQASYRGIRKAMTGA